MKIRTTYFLLLCLWLSGPSALHAQREFYSLNVDSLENELLARELSASEQMHIHRKLSWAYLYADRYENMISHSRKSAAIAQKLDSLYVAADMYNNLGVGHDYSGRPDSARIYFDKALETVMRMEKESHDTPARRDKIKAYIYGSIANLYSIEGRTGDALEYYFKALRLFEQYNNLFEIGNVLGNIGIIYYDVENYEQAETYMLRSEKIGRENGFDTHLAHSLTLLSALYERKKEYERAIASAEEALGILDKHDTNPADVLVCHLCLSEAWLRGYGDDLKSMEYAEIAYKEAVKLNIPLEISNALMQKSSILLFRGKYAESEKAALEALRIDSTYLSATQLLYELIAKANIGMGRRGKAFEYFDRFKELQMNYANENFQKQLSEMEVLYETEKKEARIAALSHDRKLYSVLAIVCGAGVLLLVVTLLLYRRYQRTQHLRVQERFEKLEQEKQLIAAESLLNGETHERERLSRELHDGLGGLLTMIKLELARIKTSLNEESKKINDAIGMMDKSIVEMRRLAHNLMPEALARFGLRPVIEEFCNGSELIHFYFFGDERRLDEKIEVNIYRIACELINNALKHSGASSIDVQLILSADKLSLTVSDNGRGLDEADGKEGLRTVRSRVELLRAAMNIYSKPGAGTEITIELNLKPM